MYDRLVGSEVLELARREAKFISVGKKGLGSAVSQSEINGPPGQGGDAGFAGCSPEGRRSRLFGRLDEELDAAAGAGIVTEVVPGITAASAAAAAITGNPSQDDTGTPVPPF